MKIKDLILKYAPEIAVLTIGTFFGIFLMFSTFIKKDGILLISTKAWSDFASHIPLIRSFSLGYNFPPEYPLFPGEAIKYHFGFYFGVGMLEKIGIPIDLALNIPSVIGFIILIFMIYLFSKMIFKSKSVGILSVTFFIFNSSLSYFYYFKNHSISLETIKNIPLISNFQSFSPYGDGIITAFWNLNIYTNQRHLALSFALSIIIIYLLILPIFKNKNVNYKISILLGIILGLSFFLHLAVLIMTSLTILFLGLLFSKIRKSTFILLLITAFIAVPQYLYLSSSGGYSLNFNPGYLLANDLTFFNLIEFWIYNLGISILLIPLGFLLANSKQRKLLISFIPIVIIGNLFQFSPEIAANHKFFNYFLLIGNMYSAYALIIIWRKKNYLKPFVVIMTFLIIFGGIIDFFPIYNDHKVSIIDYELKPESNWIIKNTPTNSVFLSTNYLYDPASLAGRKLFLGWPYFAWSQGYNTENREELLKNIYKSENKKNICDLLINNNINFVEIFTEESLNPDSPYVSKTWKNDFVKSYENQSKNYQIYEVRRNCD